MTFISTLELTNCLNIRLSRAHFWRRAVLFVFGIFLISLPQNVFASSMMCVDLFETIRFPGLEAASEKIGRSEVSYTYLTKDHPNIKRINGRITISASKVTEDSVDDLFIGFSGGSHTYLVFRGQRLDGGIAVNPINMQLLKINHKSDLLDVGIFLRFKNIPPALKDSLEQYLTENSKGLSLTCVRGVCEALEKSAGLSPHHQLTNGLLPTHTISRLIKNGLVDADGNLYAPEIYIMGGTSLKEHFKSGAMGDYSQLLAGAVLASSPLMLLHMLGISPF